MCVVELQTHSLGGGTVARELLCPLGFLVSYGPNDMKPIVCKREWYNSDKP